MAIWYIDYVNGNDGNAGTSWALAFKTLNAVTAAKGFVTGDTVRFAKSPDATSLGQTAQWTDQSKTVTLTTPVTKNIDQCDVAWTKAAANTSTTAAGARSTTNITIGVTTATANTLMAYRATGALDLSAYQQISCWIFVNAVVGASTNWTLCLCSDTAGQTVVYSAPIPAMPQSAAWTPIAVDVGTPMVGTIQSVALYSGSTPQASVSVSIDNIVACKAPSAPDSLTLLSLISKNNGTDAWLPIQNINDAVITLDNFVTVALASTRPYAGVTENVTTYKREAIRTALGATSSTAVQTIAVPINSTITLSGGWNTSTGLQDSETFYDGQNSQGYGIVLNVVQNVYFVENISVSRYNIGYSISAPGNPGSTFKFFQAVANAGSGIANSSSLCFNNSVTIANLVGNNIGINGFASSVLTIANASSNAQAITGPGVAGNILTVTTCRSNQYGVWYSGQSGQGMLIKDSLFSNNSNTDLIPTNCYGVGPIQLKNVIYTSTSLGNFPTILRIISHNDQRVPGATKIWGFNYTIVNDSTVFHTAGGMSWKMTNAGCQINYPGWLLIGRIWCPANTQRTFSAWFRRDNVGVTGALAVRGNLINGISNNVTTTTAAAINVWEQLSLTVTPTEDAVIEVEAWCWGASNNVWVTEFAAT